MRLPDNCDLLPNYTSHFFFFLALGYLLYIQQLYTDNYIQTTIYRQLYTDNYIQTTIYRQLYTDNYIQTTIYRQLYTDNYTHTWSGKYFHSAKLIILQLHGKMLLQSSYACAMVALADALANCLIIDSAICLHQPKFHHRPL